MTILSSDIKFLASKVMTDDPEGGGGPVGTVILDGDSNAIFQDVTEFDRAGGAVSVRQLFLAVQTPDRETFQDANIIVSRAPNDANVSVTLAKCAVFDQRTTIAHSLENYLIAGPVRPGFLFENHVVDQRAIQLFQRPGTAPPPIGRTLALIWDEGKSTERQQFVRVTRVETVSRTFVGGDGKPYQADIVTCDLSDSLRFNFPGNGPSQYFYVNGGTVTRDTTVADAVRYYGAVPLTAPAALNDVTVRVHSVYSQLVPSARTETVALDQRPSAVRQLTLATTPRLVTVGAAPHTKRTRVGQENRGFAWVEILKPFPAANSLVVSYMALGNWYTVVDDGLGNLTGSGVGTVNYANGSIALTLPSMPDADTSIIYSWGEKSGYENQSGRAGFRAPEFAWATPQAPVKPGSVLVEWLSGGVLRSAVDNSSGVLVSAFAAGEIDYATGKIYLRPTAMIDAGGEFKTDFEYSPAITQNFAGVSVDAGGFGTLALEAVPTGKSVTVKWITVRNVSASSGSSELVTKAEVGMKYANVGQSVVSSGFAYWNNRYDADQISLGDTVTLHVEGARSGDYAWQLYASDLSGVPVDASEVLQGGAVSGVIATTPGPAGGALYLGAVALEISSDCPTVYIHATLTHVVDGYIAATTIKRMVYAGTPVPSVPQPPQPAIKTREPIKTDGQWPFPYAPAQVVMGMYAGGYDVDGKVVHVRVPPSSSPAWGAYYDPPESEVEVWTSAQLVHGKPMTSQNGIPVTYQVWK